MRTRLTSSFRWSNLFRDSDFIGGPVLAESVDNRVIAGNFRQSHYNYYTEPGLVHLLLDEKVAGSVAAAHG